MPHRTTPGFAVAYVYYEEEPGRRTAAKLMTQDEARRIAANIAKSLSGNIRPDYKVFGAS